MADHGDGDMAFLQYDILNLARMACGTRVDNIQDYYQPVCPTSVTTGATGATGTKSP
jgi:hypothetical protein